MSASTAIPQTTDLSKSTVLVGQTPPATPNLKARSVVTAAAAAAAAPILRQSSSAPSALSPAFSSAASASAAAALPSMGSPPPVRRRPSSSETSDGQIEGSPSPDDRSNTTSAPEAKSEPLPPRPQLTISTSMSNGAHSANDVATGPGGAYLLEELAPHRLHHFGKDLQILKSLRVWTWNIPLTFETLFKVIYEAFNVALKLLGEQLVGYRCFVDSERHYVVLKSQLKALSLHFKTFFKPSILENKRYVTTSTMFFGHEWGTEYTGYRTFIFRGNYLFRSHKDLMERALTSF